MAHIAANPHLTTQMKPNGSPQCSKWAQQTNSYAGWYINKTTLDGLIKQQIKEYYAGLEHQNATHCYINMSTRNGINTT